MDFKVFMLITLAITVYIILGGLLFRFIEQSREDSDDEANVVIVHKIENGPFFNKDDVNDFLLKLLDKVVDADNWTLNLTILDENNKTHDTFNLVDANTNNITNRSSLFLHTSIKIQNHNKWDLYGSIFFAETLVTTIGYGHVAPATVAGRLLACVYSIVGIPLIGLWATAIGENIIEAATLLRNRIDVAKQYYRHFLIAEALTIVAVGSGIFIFLPAWLFSFMEEWSYPDGIYYSVITLATIGLGDFVAGSRDDAPGWYRVLLNFWLLFGLGWLSMIISLSISIFKTKATEVVQQAGETVAQIKQKLVANRIMLARRKSFAGKRQVSVMLSKTSSAVHIIDLSSGASRTIAGDDDAKSDEYSVSSRKQSLVRTSSVVIVSEENQRLSPTVSPGPRSRHGSLQAEEAFGFQTHHLMQLPTISENDSQPKLAQLSPFHIRERTHRSPSWIIGDDLIVQTSKRRPSLGPKSASVLLFDRNQVQEAFGANVNNSTLEQISHEAASAMTDVGIMINIVEPDDDNDRSTDDPMRPASVSPIATPVPSQRPSLVITNNSRPSIASTPPGFYHVPLRGNSLFEGAAKNLVPAHKGIDNLVVLTDNGIAESLGCEITVLRPRSKSSER